MSKEGLDAGLSLSEAVASSKRLAAGKSQVAPPPAAPRPPAAAPRKDLGPPALGAPRRTLDSAAMLFAPSAANASSNRMLFSLWGSREPERRAAPSAKPADERIPPPGDASPAPDQSATISLVDSTANLLRPLLRQWLDENMACVVVRALEMEAREGPGRASKPDEQ